jgi:hypothetical protein
LATLDTWTGETGQNVCSALTCDGEYIYAGLLTSPGQVVQIDPSDMSAVETWEGDTWTRNCHALTFDGLYIYAAIEMYVGHVEPSLDFWFGGVQLLDPEDMSEGDLWYQTLEEGFVTCLAFTGDFVYAGYDSSPAKVVKVE